MKLLSLEDHKNKKVNSNAWLPFGTTLTNCPVLKCELFSVATSFPVFFLKNPETGELSLSCLFTLVSDSNLFAEKGDWASPYTPLNIRRYPFSVSVSPNSDSSGEIYIDEAAFDQEGQALFEDGGEPTDFLENYRKILGLIASDQQPTRQFSERLVDLGLITGMSLKLQRKSGPFSVSELYGLDRAKLQNLSGEQLAELNASGDLEAISALSMSLGQISRLIWMENQNTGDPIFQFSIIPSK